jgi:hypothetical protein
MCTNGVTQVVIHGVQLGVKHRVNLAEGEGDHGGGCAEERRAVVGEDEEAPHLV